MEDVLLDAVGLVDGVDELTVRVAASAVAYVADLVVRGDQIFLLFDFALGASAGDLQVLQDVLVSEVAPWELDGHDVSARVASSGRVLAAQGVMTLGDMQPVIDHHVRQMLPDADDNSIDTTLDAFVRVLEASASRRERIGFTPKAAERTVEDWIVGHLGEVAEWCELPPLELFKRQFRFNSGRRADLIYRTTAGGNGFDRGLWVVLELKAGRLLPLDVDQLADYVRSAEEELDVDGDGVLGFLIGDGWTDAVLQRISELESPIACQNLVSIGFHQDLYDSVRALEHGD